MKINNPLTKIKSLLYPDWYFTCRRCKKLKKRNYKRTKLFFDTLKYCNSCDDSLIGLT